MARLPQVTVYKTSKWGKALGVIAVFTADPASFQDMDLQEWVTFLREQDVIHNGTAFHAEYIYTQEELNG